MNDDWRNNPKLAGMDRSKLDMLQNLASQGSSKGANEMLPFLMSAAAQGINNGLKFNADESAYIGRTYGDAPKVDGYIFVQTGELLMTGDFAKVRVTGALEYDLIGELADEYTE